MPTPLPPSVLWGTVPAAPPAVDPPIQQDANFVKDPGAQRLYNAYLDSQIRAGATHIVQSLVGGLTGTWAQLDPTSAPVAIGQWVCLAGSFNRTVTLANLAALSAAGSPFGIALTPGTPGGWMRVGLEGLVPPTITGLLIGTTSLFAIVNTSTGYTTTVATVGNNNYPVGTVDAAANLNCRVQLPPAPGGAGLTVAGTGFWPVVGGVIGSTARAVNLASNTDVTGLLPFINGGHLQGDINVTHALPGTFDATHQIAYCDTATGTCSITFPLASVFPGGTVPPDWQVLVVDTAGQASTNAITVNPNGNTVWNPGSVSFGASSFTLTSPGGGFLWQWDINKSHYDLISSGGAGTGALPAPGATIVSNQTIGPGDVWKLFAATVAPYTITWGTLLPGVLYRLQNMIGIGAATLESNPVTLSRGANTFTMEDPQHRFAATANSVLLSVSEQTYEWVLDTTNSPAVLRCMRQAQ